MEYQTVQIDLCSIERANMRAKDYVQHAIEVYNRVTLDPERRERIAAQQCVVCWRSSRIGGAAMTSRPCGLCGTVVHSANTNVDVLCPECAKRARLCRHCGADLDLKNRRKRDLGTTPTPQETSK